MQSVHVITNVVSSNLAHIEVNSIQHYLIKFVSDFRKEVVILKTGAHMLVKLYIRNKRWCAIKNTA
jgi:hypothetical protein